MSQEPKKTPCLNKLLSPNMMEDCIKQLQEVQEQVVELKQLYQSKCKQLNDFKKCHKSLLQENVKLQSAVDALNKEIKRRRNGNSTEVESDLFMIIHKAFAEKIHEYEDEKEIAFGLLKEYHHDMHRAIINGLSDMMLGKGIGDVINGMKLSMDETAVKISKRIKYDCESEFALQVAKHFDKSTWGTLDQKDDQDDTMGQQ